MKECFVNIPGFENSYLISKEGNIKSLPKDNYSKGESLLKPSIKRNGYACAVLFKNTKRNYIGVHRLVALTFIPNPENKLHVNHKDGNKLNNHVENLEWMTASENQKHSYNVLLRTRQKGSENKRSKLVIQVSKDGFLVGVYASISECERETKISSSNIMRCLSGKRKSAGKYLWY